MYFSTMTSSTVASLTFAMATMTLETSTESNELQNYGFSTEKWLIESLVRAERNYSEARCYFEKVRRELNEELRVCRESNHSASVELARVRRELEDANADRANLSAQLGSVRVELEQCKANAIGKRPAPAKCQEPTSCYVETPGIGAHKISIDSKNWIEAKGACEGDNAYLAIPNSDAEAQLFADMILGVYGIRNASSDYHVYAWLGISGKLTNWTTIFGDSINGTGFYNHWNYPRNKLDGNCVLMSPRIYLKEIVEPMGLYGHSCDYMYPYICELHE